MARRTLHGQQEEALRSSQVRQQRRSHVHQERLDKTKSIAQLGEKRRRTPLVWLIKVPESVTQSSWHKARTGYASRAVLGGGASSGEPRFARTRFAGDISPGTPHRRQGGRGGVSGSAPVHCCPGRF